MRYSLEEQLLHASLLCGLKTTGSPAYRLQLFFIANKELGSKSHQSDFQRAIETGVDKSRYWINFDGRGSGEYLFTELGYAGAKKIFGKIKPIYHPVMGRDYHVLVKGIFNNLLIEIETKGNIKNLQQYPLIMQLSIPQKKHVSLLKKMQMFIYQQLVSQQLEFYIILQ